LGARGRRGGLRNKWDDGDGFDAFCQHDLVENPFRWPGSET